MRGATQYVPPTHVALRLVSVPFALRPNVERNAQPRTTGRKSSRLERKPWPPPEVTHDSSSTGEVP